MPKVLLDCGNCGPDFNSIRQMASSTFGATVLQAHGAEDAIEILRERDVDLVTVNRKLDRDYTDGIEVIKQIKADDRIASIPVMLVTNYQEHQDTAVAIGCVRGFGKLAINTPETAALLRPYLAAEEASIERED